MRKPERKGVWRFLAISGLVFLSHCILALAFTYSRIGEDEAVMRTVVPKIVFDMDHKYLTSLDGPERLPSSNPELLPFSYLRNFLPFAKTRPKFAQIYGWDVPLSEDDWYDDIWKKFGSHGFLTFTLPAYSLDGRYAVITASVQEGGLYGQGKSFVLEKVYGVWKVIHEEVTFES